MGTGWWGVIGLFEADGALLTGATDTKHQIYWETVSNLGVDESEGG